MDIQFKDYNTPRCLIYSLPKRGRPALIGMILEGWDRRFHVSIVIGEKVIGTASKEKRADARRWAIDFAGTLGP